jgi:N-acetylmuramoyl-L-alanine amidase
MLLKEYTNQNTKGIAGISTQLCAQAVSMGFMTKVNHPNIKIDSDSLVHLYLQPAAAAALVKVAAKKPIVVSTAYRTLAQQYILKKNLPGLVARVGRSDHGSGKSLDITNYEEVQTLLEANGFVQSYPGNDPVHFDYEDGEDYRELTVKAFQQLWNLNHKSAEQLTADGDAGARTLEALRNTPVDGFINATAIGELQEGMVSPAVGLLQRKLKSLGYYKGLDNEVFNASTKAALIAYQQAQGLVADGIAGRKTLRKLGLIT